MSGNLLLITSLKFYGKDTALSWSSLWSTRSVVSRFHKGNPQRNCDPHGTIIKYAEAEVTCSHIFYYEEQSVLVLFYFISVKTMLSAWQNSLMSYMACDSKTMSPDLQGCHTSSRFLSQRQSSDRVCSVQLVKHKLAQYGACAVSSGHQHTRGFSTACQPFNLRLRLSWCWGKCRGMGLCFLVWRCSQI